VNSMYLITAREVNIV